MFSATMPRRNSALGPATCWDHPGHGPRSVPPPSGRDTVSHAPLPGRTTPQDGLCSWSFCVHTDTKSSAGIYSHQNTAPKNLGAKTGQDRLQGRHPCRVILSQKRRPGCLGTAFATAPFRFSWANRRCGTGNRCDPGFPRDQLRHP